MKDTVEELLSQRKIFFSQQGEDGILAFVLSKIPDKTGWCVELGAWDGKSESNTYYFILHHGYHGVMIEADPFKYNLLRENMKSHDTICINAFIRPEGENKLDNILRSTLSRGLAERALFIGHAGLVQLRVQLEHGLLGGLQHCVKSSDDGHGQDHIPVLAPDVHVLEDIVGDVPDESRNPIQIPVGHACLRVVYRMVRYSVKRLLPLL